MPLQLNDEEMSVLMSLAGPIDQQRRPQFLQEVAQELEVKRQAGEIAGLDCPLSPIWHCSGTRFGDLGPKTCQESPVAARQRKGAHDNQEETMRRFMVHLVTEVEFEDGDEASDKTVQNYQKHLSETVRNAAKGSRSGQSRAPGSRLSRSQKSRMSSNARLRGHDARQHAPKRRPRRHRYMRELRPATTSPGSWNSTATPSWPELLTAIALERRLGEHAVRREATGQPSGAIGVCAYNIDCHTLNRAACIWFVSCIQVEGVGAVGRNRLITRWPRVIGGNDASAPIANRDMKSDEHRIGAVVYELAYGSQNL
jgi:hypothetical protein